MEISIGGRQSGQNLYNALKLYNYIDSLQNDTTVRVIKKNGICVLCVDESISKEKVKDKIEELNKAYEDSKDENGESEYYYPDYTIRVLEELLESE